jgi:hypothetical protein
MAEVELHPAKKIKSLLPSSHLLREKRMDLLLREWVRLVVKYDETPLRAMVRGSRNFR